MCGRQQCGEQEMIKDWGRNGAGKIAMHFVNTILAFSKQEIVLKNGEQDTAELK